MTSWESLEIAEDILKCVQAQGYEKMTPVQGSTIPLFIGNKDVVVEAVTGSGKTAAFVIPIIQRYIDRKAEFTRGNVFSVIVAPTRELASQIVTVFENFSKNLNEEHQIEVQPIIGGRTSFQEDVQRFLEQKPHVLIGTPGRLNEFISISQVKNKFRDFDCLVMDEADKLLDVSFETTVREIVSKLPRQKRVGLFSATVSSAGKMILKLGMANPVKIVVTSAQATPDALSIEYLVVQVADKLKYLLMTLKQSSFSKCIVYLPTCIGVTYFYSMLQFLTKENKSLKFFSIHGKLPLKSQIRTLENFGKSSDNSVLLATDVAARGLDIPDVDLVVQLDPPTDPDVFLHRCGRTGRANRVGRALVFLTEGLEQNYVDFMRVKKVSMEQFECSYDSLDSEIAMNYNLTSSIDKLISKWMLQDRARYDLAVKSYVGFIRYYSKHSASSIFRLESMDYIGLAKLYGLFRIPKMPEMRYIPEEVLSQFPEGWITKIDLNAYKYKNPEKELARLAEMKATAKKEAEKLRKKEAKKANAAWSGKKGIKEVRQERREKTKRKREALENEGSSDEEVQKDWKEEVRKKKKVVSVAKFDL